MAGKLFFGGIPTAPDVALLMERVQAEPGTSVDYLTVAEIIGVAADSSRFRTVTGAWRKRLFRDSNIQTSAEGGAFHFLTADAAQDEVGARLHRIGRATGRVVRVVSTIRPEELTTEERRQRYTLHVRESRALLDAAQASAKRLAAPAAKAAPLRLAKGGES